MDKNQGGLLYKDLRHQGKKYNKRANQYGSRSRIVARVDISQRPIIVNDKARLGDWKLDTVIGSKGSDVLLTIVERASKLVRIVKVPNKTADLVRLLSWGFFNACFRSWKNHSLSGFHK